MTEINKDFIELIDSLLPFLGIAAFGGVYGVIRRGFKSFKEFVISMMASILAGFITCACMQAAEANSYFIAAACAVAGALGDRAIQLFQSHFISVLVPEKKEVSKKHFEE